MFIAFYDVDINVKLDKKKCPKSNLKSSQNTLPKMTKLDYFTNSFHHVISNRVQFVSNLPSSISEHTGYA